MTHHPFGWELPPGCSHADIERAMGGDIPQECEDCELYNQELETCPYQDNEDNCYKLSLITKCEVCDKPLHKVKGSFTAEEIAYGDDAIYCCSEECAKKIQEEIDKLYAEMETQEHQEEIIVQSEADE